MSKRHITSSPNFPNANKVVLPEREADADAAVQAFVEGCPDGFTVADRERRKAADARRAAA